MAQRLAAVSLGVESEVPVKPHQTLAQDRYLLRRDAQGFASPESGVDANAAHFALLADRHDDQVERNAAMHCRLALGFGHQRVVAALFEIVHGAEAAALVRGSSRDAEYPQGFGRLLVRLLNLVAEKGHRPVSEPVEQGLALFVVDLFGV